MHVLLESEKQSKHSADFPEIFSDQSSLKKKLLLNSTAGNQEKMQVATGPLLTEIISSAGLFGAERSLPDPQEGYCSNPENFRHL